MLKKMKWMGRAGRTSVALAIVALAQSAAAGTDCWTYTPGKTYGTISWTDSSGFENIVQGVTCSDDGSLKLRGDRNKNSTTIKNLDFSLPVKTEDGTTLSFAPDFLAWEENSAVLGYITGLTNVVLHPSMTVLGNFCFKGCTALERVRLGDALENISKYSFADDGELVTIEPFFPDSLKIIGEFAFQNCKKLEGDFVANGLTSIVKRAFHTCSVLHGADFSQSTVTELPEFVFYNCSGLKTVALPDTLTLIGEGVFQNASLTTVTPLLPPRIETLGTGSDNAPFINNPIEGHLTVPATLSRIEKKMFRSSKIESVTAQKKGLKYIDEHAFYDDKLLTNIVLSAEMEGFSYRWLNGTGTSGVDQHVWFRNLPADIPANCWEGAKSMNITIHLPWSKRDEWIAWVQSEPSGHTFTFNNNAKTLPTKIGEVGTWRSNTTQYVTWWKDSESALIIYFR